MKNISDKDIYQVSKIMRRAGNVRRFHTHRMTFPDMVNIHSYNASLLVYHIASEYNKAAGFEVVNPLLCSFYMLTHDVSEHIVGDVPGNIKSEYSVVKETFDKIEDDWKKNNLPSYFCFDGDVKLNEVEEFLCHFVDKFEAFQTTMEELRNGNYSFKYPYSRMLEYIPKLIEEICIENNAPLLMNILQNLFNRAVEDFNHNQLYRGD